MAIDRAALNNIARQNAARIDASVNSQPVLTDYINPSEQRLKSAQTLASRTNPSLGGAMAAAQSADTMLTDEQKYGLLAEQYKKLSTQAPAIQSNKAMEEWAWQLYDVKSQMDAIKSPLKLGEKLEYGAANTVGVIPKMMENTSDTILGGGANLLADILTEGKALLTGNDESRAADWLRQKAEDVYNTDGLLGAASWGDRVREKYDPRLTDADRKISNFVQSGTNMLASLALGNVAGGILGQVAGAGASTLAGTQAAQQATQLGQNLSRGFLGAGAAGGATKQALDQGAEIGDAIAYGQLTGLLETGIESLGGGIPGMGQGRATQAIQKVLNVARQNGALGTLLDMANEGAEEVLTAALDPYIQRLTYNPEAEAATLKELGAAFASGALLSGIMQGGAYVAGNLPSLPARTGNTQNGAQGVLNAPQAAQTAQGGNNATPTLTPPTEQETAVQGQNKTASTGEAENQMLTDKDIEQYMQTGVREHVRNQKAEIVKSGQSPLLTTMGQIKAFIRGAMSGEIQNTIKGYGRVGRRMARDIRAADDSVNVDGFYLELDANRLSHLSDHIQDDGDPRNIPLTENQAENLTSYIDNYDDVLDVVRRKDGSVRLTLGKKINGHAVIIELVSKGRKSIQPVTAWQNTTEHYQRKYGMKNAQPINTSHPTQSETSGYKPTVQGAPTPQTADAYASAHTAKPENVVTDALDATRVSQPPDGVNTNYAQSTANDSTLPEGLGTASSQNPTPAKKSKVGTNTLTNSPYITQAQKQRYNPEALTYESTTNEKDMLSASERLALDYAGEEQHIRENGIQTSEDLHVAFALMFDAIAQDGETGNAARHWMQRLADAGSNAGQIVQAFSVYAHTPQGKVVQAQKIVDAINAGTSPDGAQREPSTEREKLKRARSEKQAEHRKQIADVRAQEIIEEFTNGEDVVHARQAAKRHSESKHRETAGRHVARAITDATGYTAATWADKTGRAIANLRPQPSEKTTAQIIMQDLVRFAGSNVPKANIQKAKGRTDADRMADYLANLPYYDSAWQSAKAQIREKYADDPAALEEFDRYLNHTIRESVLNTVYDAEHVARLSDMEIHGIFRLMQQSQDAEPGSYEANMYEAMANKIVAEKMPHKFRDKLTAALMTNMLGNFRTLITRNALGNALFAVPEQLSKGFATGIDALVSVATGERTHMVTPGYYKAYASGFGKGAKEAALDFKYGIKTPRSGEALDYTAQHEAFELKAAQIANRLVQFGLDVGDRPFYEANYAARMVELQRIRDKNKLNPEMAANFDALADLEARLFALEAVFQSKNETAEGLGDLRSGIQNIIQGITGISLGGQFSIPFTQTPGGMLQRTAEYLPGLGTVKNIISTGKEIANKEFDQSRFSMEAGRNLVGLGAAAGLAQLVLSGIITGGLYGDDNEKVKEAGGQQEYSIKIGDRYYGYEWIPVLGAITGGVADAINAFQESDPNANAILQGIGAGLGTVTNMSAMQGLNRMFGGYNSTVQGFGQMLLEGTSQAVPSLIRQVANTSDRYARQTYDPRPLVMQWNKIISGIPVLRERLPMLYDIYGQPIEQNQGRDIGEKALENMLLPGYVSEEVNDPKTNILLEISEAGFDLDPPDTPKKYKDKKLTAQEYATYSETSGLTFSELMDIMVGNTKFDALDVEAKALVVDKMQEYSADEAKRQLAESRGEEYSSDWDDESALPSNILADVLIYKRAVNDVSSGKDGSYTAMDALIDAASGLSGRARTVLEEETPLFTRLVMAADSGISAEQYMKAHNAVSALGEATFSEKAQTIMSVSGLDSDQQWYMLSDVKGGGSGNKDKPATAKAAGIPITAYVSAEEAIQAAKDAKGSTSLSRDEVIDALEPLSASDAVKSKLYALYANAKTNNPWGDDYAESLNWKYIP